MTPPRSAIVDPGATSVVQPRRMPTRCLVLALALALPACGPIAYVGQVTRGADSAVEAARAVNAAKYSPYWWTRATLYLRQARVEAASADFQAANRFGRLAEDAARNARKEALACAADPEPCQPPPARGVVPRRAPGAAETTGTMAPLDAGEDAP